MNRAILIVICDFLVSAMLTMMTGMVPGHTGGTGVGLDENTTKVLLADLNKRQQEIEALRAQLRDNLNNGAADPAMQEELKKLTAELAANLARQGRLKAALAATAENTGLLDADRLRKRLEEEKLRLLELQIQLQDTEKDLSGNKAALKKVSGELRRKEQDLALEQRELLRTRQSLSETSKALVDMTKENTRTRTELARSETRREAAEADARRTGRELNETREDLKRSNDQLLDETRRHSETRSELAKKDTEVRERNRELGVARDSLRKLSAAHSQTEGKLGALQIRFAETTGRLVSKEQDNASLKDLNTRLERELLAIRLQAKEAETGKLLMQETLKSTVQELSASRQELQQAKQSNARLDASLESMKQAAAKASAPEKHDVFKRYASAVIRVESTVSEKAFMGDRTGKETSFYPVVNFNGRNLIVGALNRFAGDWSKVLDFKNVTLVSMRYSAPFGKKGESGILLTGSMLVHPQQLHVAAFPFNGKDFQALDTVDAAKLQERGVDGLFLFKNGSFESNARLDGRVSLVMDKDNPSIFIRNAGRSNNELNAEPGDIILTLHGEFVGVVSAREEIDRVSGARVPLIKDCNTFWNGALLVPLEKQSGEQYFTRFASAMQKLREKFKAGYHRY
jgi:chromosome segregation ATPase